MRGDSVDVVVFLQYVQFHDNIELSNYQLRARLYACSLLPPHHFLVFF